jgi:hypothetical protein
MHKRLPNQRRKESWLQIYETRRPMKIQFLSESGKVLGTRTIKTVEGAIELARKRVQQSCGSHTTRVNPKEMRFGTVPFKRWRANDIAGTNNERFYPLGPRADALI